METLWFGRDIFGRHSLLASIKPCHVIISSVGFMNSDLIEVPALGVYELTMDTKFDINLVPWSNRQGFIYWKKSETFPKPKFKMEKLCQS